MEPRILVRDEDEVLSFTWNALYAFVGPKQIIASALIFRTLERAFGDLSEGRVPDRAELRFLSGFPGRGIAECVELVTRIPSRYPERYAVEPEAAPQEAPDSVGGKLYFEVQVGTRRRGYWPSEAFFDDGFREKVVRYQEGDGTEDERASYRAYKRSLAEAVLGADSRILIASREVPAR